MLFGDFSSIVSKGIWTAQIPSKFITFLTTKSNLFVESDKWFS
jgi:hypothetical protein